jgi:hypothetical protein
MFCVVTVAAEQRAVSVMSSASTTSQSTHLHPSNELDDEGETIEQWALRLTAQWNEQLRKQPENVDLWLQFVDFQDEVTHFSYFIANVVSFNIFLVLYTGVSSAAQQKRSCFVRTQSRHFTARAAVLAGLGQTSTRLL